MDPSKPLEIRGMAVKSICNIITHYVSGDTLIRKFQTMLRSGSYFFHPILPVNPPAIYRLSDTIGVHQKSIFEPT